MPGSPVSGDFDESILDFLQALDVQQAIDQAENRFGNVSGPGNTPIRLPSPPSYPPLASLLSPHPMSPVPEETSPLPAEEPTTSPRDNWIPMPGLCAPFMHPPSIFRPNRSTTPAELANITPRPPSSEERQFYYYHGPSFATTTTTTHQLLFRSDSHLGDSPSHHSPWMTDLFPAGPPDSAHPLLPLVRSQKVVVPWPRAHKVRPLQRPDGANVSYPELLGLSLRRDRFVRDALANRGVPPSRSRPDPDPVDLHLELQCELERDARSALCGAATVRWWGFRAFRIEYRGTCVEEEEEDDDDDAEKNNTQLVLLICAEPGGALDDFERAAKLAMQCKKILLQNGVRNVEVEVMQEARKEDPYDEDVTPEWA